MDMLDPLDTSEQVEDKVMLAHSLGINHQSMDSDDDPPTLSPQSLLQTPEDDVQYSFRSSDGTVTYGVLKVEDNVPLMAQNFCNSTVPQIVTSNINGQLYVIGNASDVFVSHPTAPPRPIVPRTAATEATIMPANPNISNKKQKRDDRRRATHNEVERRRRDKINNWINKLAKIIPETPSSATTTEMKNNGNFDGQSKGGILAKACEYITELRDCHQQLEECDAERKRLAAGCEKLKEKNARLDMENKALRELLTKNGIIVLDD